MVDDSLLAYYFTIEDTKGYYIVTAVDTLNPIMEYSVEAPYPISFDQKGNKKAYYIGINNIIFANNAQEIQKKFIEDNKNDLETSKVEEEEIKKVKEEKVKEKKSFEEKVKKEKSLKNVTTAEASVSNNEKKVQELDTEINQIDVKLQEYDDLQLDLETSKLEPFVKQPKRSSQWDALLATEESKPSENVFRAAAATSAKLDVPRWYQHMSGVVDPRSACGPTSAAMVMNYYHDIRGFSTVRDDSYFGSKATTINNLRYDMNSFAWGIAGATLNDWANGATRHIRETATSNWLPVVVTNSASASYSNSLKYRSAIVNQHPVAIRFHYKVENNLGLKYHFVVGVGWYLNGTNYDNLMVTFEDPDGDPPTYRAFDWGNLLQDFNFAHLEF